jgi:hypothetical protein
MFEDIWSEQCFSRDPTHSDPHTAWLQYFFCHCPHHHHYHDQHQCLNLSALFIKKIGSSFHHDLGCQMDCNPLDVLSINWFGMHSHALI